MDDIYFYKLLNTRTRLFFFACLNDGAGAALNVAAPAPQHVQYDSLKQIKTHYKKSLLILKLYFHNGSLANVWIFYYLSGGTTDQSSKVLKHGGPLKLQQQQQQQQQLQKRQHQLMKRCFSS